MKVTTEIHTFTSPLYLESGRIFEPYKIAYETYGELNDDKSNVIVICHALSGSAHAAGKYTTQDAKPGWWDGLIGEGKAVDTRQWFVICTNVIGSCFGSTGPASLNPHTMESYRFRFPVLSIKDMVKAQKILLATLGIYNVHAIIGGSMGGMQALTFGVEYPDFAKIIIPMATTYAASAWVIAFNKVAQSALLADPSFNEGNYDVTKVKEEGMAGLSAARMAGYLTYLSPSTMEQKFGRNYVANDGLFELFGRFEVERYLDYNGHNFPKWFDPLSFLYITKAINIFDLSRGYDSLEEAIKRIKARLVLISFTGDWLFFAHEMKKIADIACTFTPNNVSYLEVHSHYGHDAFLVELEKFDFLVKEELEKDR